MTVVLLRANESRRPSGHPVQCVQFFAVVVQTVKEGTSLASDADTVKIIKVLHFY